MIADRFFASQRLLGVLHLVGGAVMWLVSTRTTFGCRMPALTLASSANIEAKSLLCASSSRITLSAKGPLRASFQRITDSAARSMRGRFSGWAARPTRSRRRPGGMSVSLSSVTMLRMPGISVLAGPNGLGVSGGCGGDPGSASKASSRSPSSRTRCPAWLA